MLYPVKITETLQRTVVVESSSKETAQFRVEEDWKASKHILTADDYAGVTFTVGKPNTLHPQA